VLLAAHHPFRMQFPVDGPGLCCSGIHPPDSGPGVFETKVVGPAAIPAGAMTRGQGRGSRLRSVR
jgi:hypothetical protein